MPTSNGPSQPNASCPYFAQFRPRGRDYTYCLCEALDEEPYIPCQTELADLCQGDFARCPRFQVARRREAARAKDADQRAA